jgi:hypothetical protein
LILYTGVLAPNSKLRARVAVFGRQPALPDAREGAAEHTPTHASLTANAIGRPERVAEPGGYSSEWARLMRRAFDLDVLRCPNCSNRMRVLALIERPQTARRILRHLGMRDHPPPIAPARIPDTSFDDVA